MNSTSCEPFSRPMFNTFNGNADFLSSSEALDIASDEDIRGFLTDLVSKEQQKQQEQPVVPDNIDRMILSDDDDDELSYEVFKNLLDPVPIVPAAVSLHTGGDGDDDDDGDSDLEQNFEDEEPPSSFEDVSPAHLFAPQPHLSRRYSSEGLPQGYSHLPLLQQEALPESYNSSGISQNHQQQLQRLHLHRRASTGDCVPNYPMPSVGIIPPTTSSLQQHEANVNNMQVHHQQQLRHSFHHRRTKHHHHPYASGGGSHLLSNASNHSRTTDTSIEDTAARLNDIMMKSKVTQSALQNWDRKNGLPKSHSQTMVNSSRSRKQLQEGVVLAKWDGTPLLDIHGVPIVGARKRQGERGASSKRNSSEGMSSQSEHIRQDGHDLLEEDKKEVRCYSGHVRSRTSSTTSKKKQSMVQSEHIRRFDDMDDNEPIPVFNKSADDETTSKFFMRRFSSTD
mmetsp:Transcript_27834/g.42602  ORF Transcript_27834/g.42602 Transcript_27834/m.42602 type:complete len:451 (+) Transcript_27834:321-1673(+)|eukprot:CAMPEP_0195292492 /NCGR_PEP_ID=MMETSP0707-20130614/9795_1 /TAXON_ID=33640 /ORGANISM="Asterionellopsis glacialis, Strain CCMP134" /LENGTH=450 /DNA_ID=CAMNT_0040352969 /DNA_START=278 /DNA_END=1630 /DNA_ORIENTATION=-